eukprot:UN25601
MDWWDNWYCYTDGWDCTDWIQPWRINVTWDGYQYKESDSCEGSDIIVDSFTRHDYFASDWDYFEKTDFHELEIIQWGKGKFDAYWKSALSVIAPGLLWLFIYFMSTSAFFTYLIRERNSGIKSMMQVMGLDTFTYWCSQIASFTFEGFPIMLAGGIGCAIFVSAQTGNGDMGVYVFFRCLYVILIWHHFLFTLACT